MKYLKSKPNSIEESILQMWEKAAKQAEDNTNDKSDDGEGMDKVQPKALKKKFKDRKDKDIDNDGDVDSLISIYTQDVKQSLKQLRKRTLMLEHQRTPSLNLR